MYAGATRIRGRGVKAKFSRRSLLAGAGCAIAGSAAGQLLAVAQAQEAAQARQGQAGAGVCMTMLFENGARAKFDTDKYVKRHLPMLRELYGDSVERIELRTAAGAAKSLPSSVLATATLWIRDVPGFSQQLGANADRINKDLDSVARGNRQAQVDRVVVEMGTPRADVPADSHVFSLFYPARSPVMAGPRGGRPPGAGPGSAGAGAGPGPGGAGVAANPGAGAASASLDTQYFSTTFLPKLYSLYGADAIRRLEATVGVDQAGQKAAYLAAYHLLIRDRGAYDERQGAVFGEMQQDASQFTTIFPLFADMRVTAIA